ncbi:outer membrane protein assembly factor BamE domain-containing protein [Burkholderia pyrrocinia]|uniref:outer membrane protein assembly factor BamE domain-containing protein n=1 Tax=Burkholderia pyrrocinia TaxID=60550 RepID=UPI001ABAFA86|nr:OmpA family protein [Burkholderia pyrrocinia]
MAQLINPVALVAALLMSGVVHADDGVVFPPRTAAWLKEGTPAKVESVQQVAPGVSREAVYALLGKPHFSRAYCHAREWDYLLDLPNGSGHPTLSCQYKVRFDGHDKVRDKHWQDPACEALATLPAKAEAPGPVGSEHFTVAQDVVFAFDRSAPGDMLPGGIAELERIGGQVKADYRKLTSVTIIGHTDGLGKPAYSQELSLARAQTVRDYLAGHGSLPSGAIVATGVGSIQPASRDCPPGQSDKATQCVQLDRQVTVDVTGERRQ